MTSPEHGDIVSWLREQISSDEAARDSGRDATGVDRSESDDWKWVRSHKRQVEAYRRIIDEHQPSVEYPDAYCVLCQWDICCDAPKADYHRGAGEFPCPTLRALASIYSDREGFREEWSL